MRQIATRRGDQEDVHIAHRTPGTRLRRLESSLRRRSDRQGALGVRRYRIMRTTDDPSHVMIDLEFDSLGEAEAVKAALGEVEFDSPGEAEAVRAALEDPTSPLEVTHGLRVRIAEVVETKEY